MLKAPAPDTTQHPNTPTARLLLDNFWALPVNWSFVNPSQRNGYIQWNFCRAPGWLQKSGLTAQ